eukprot:XP_014782767.1 PREDICTED: methylmalonic aciduria and homocystinuria type C protein homolog isoform X2 [Octopus bimaculoides]
MYVQWYNYLADAKYHLPYEKDTIAFTIIGRPDMFEKAFKTFVCNRTSKPLVDIDYKFIMFYMKKIQQEYNNVDIILRNVRGHHSNLNTNIAAHVTGVAYRYTQSDVLHYTWPKTKKPLEFAVHHKYGAWYTVPAVIVFRDFKLPSLLYPLPFDALPSHEHRRYVLQSLHNGTMEWRHASFMPGRQPFSEEAKQYFSSKFNQRISIVKKTKQSCKEGRFTYFFKHILPAFMPILGCCM